MPRATPRAARAALFTAILLTAGAAAADLAPPRPLQPSPPVQTKPAAAASILAPPAASSAAVAPPAASSAAVAPPSPSASAAVAPPPSASAASPAPSSSVPVRDDLCADAVATWAKNASQRSGLAITPASCSAGIVRLAVAGAGCDFEVSYTRGFQRTPDGKIGVSPIANLDWKDAPEPMKKALAGILTALTQDSTLLIPAGEPVFGKPAETVFLGSRLNQALVGAGGLFGLAALGLWLKRRKGGPTSPPAPPAPPASPDPPA